jgi:glycosyltransferase involved in cell wall biosynthesis
MAHVVMLVHSDYYHDNRVVREAELLAADRYKVTVLAAETGLDVPFRKGYSNGVEVITCGLSAVSGKRRFYQMMKTFHSRLKNMRADIIHAHDLDTLLPAWRYARSKDIPLIYDSHELYLESTGLRGRRINRALWSRLENLLIHHAAVVITVCGSIADHLQKRYSLVREPVVIRNFSSADINRNTSDIPPQIQDLRSRVHFMCIYQGVLREGRGLAMLPDIIAGASRWGAVVCGDGPMRSALQKQIDKAGLQDRIILTGRLAHHVLTSVTASADAGYCYIEPISLSYRYALPNKLSEYVQARVPVIGSDLPEISALINDFHIGYVCGNQNEIGACLKKLEAGETRVRFRKQMDLAAPSLSWEHEGKKLTDLYENLVH